jgi:chaperone BCS1
LYFGPPGTGKSTAIKALAGELDLPLYTINLSNMDDDDLQYALGRTSVPCVLAIEDVDSFEFAHARNNVKAEADSTGVKIQKTRRYRVLKKNTTCQVTLAGLLNAIDGIASKEGTILVLTSNNPGVLDPALIRSGRVDKRYEFKHLESQQVLEMFKVFFEDKKDLHKKVLDFCKNKSHSASWWQGYFLDHENDIEKAFK